MLAFWESYRGIAPWYLGTHKEVKWRDNWTSSTAQYHNSFYKSREEGKLVILEFKIGNYL